MNILTVCLLVFFKLASITTDNDRITYTYDPAGNILTELYETYNNNWENFAILTHTYNSSGNEISYLEEHWENGEWVNKIRYNKTYNSSGKMTEKFFEKYAFTTGWVNYARDSYDYDNSGNSILLLCELWSNGVWVNDMKYTSSFDNNNNPVEKLTQKFTNGSWVSKNKSTYTYNSSNQMLTWIQEFYTDGIMHSRWKYSYTYDEYGNNTLWLTEKWEENNWINISRISDSYDSGLMMISIKENWENNMWNYVTRDSYTYRDKIINTHLIEKWIDQSWSNDYLEENSFDVSGNITDYEMKKWTSNIWDNFIKQSFTYDNQGNAFHGESYIWENGSWVSTGNPIPVYYNNNQNTFITWGKYFDAQYINITDAVEKSPVNLSCRLEQNYPNPFNPTTSINYSIAKEGHVKLAVYDIAGREVYMLVDEVKAAGNYTIEFNGSSLASGIYLYTLRSADYSSTKKLLLLK